MMTNKHNEILQDFSDMTMLVFGFWFISSRYISGSLENGFFKNFFKGFLKFSFV